MVNRVNAMVTKKPGLIELQEFPYPRVASDGIIVKTTMVGVCGTDPHIYRGKMECDFPVIQGHECIGVVEEIGENAHEAMVVVGGPLRKGDRVTWFPGIKCGRCWTCMFLPSNNHYLCANPKMKFGLGTTCEKPPHLFGGFSEYVYLIPGTWVYKIPDELTDEEAVLIDILNVPRLEKAQAPAVAVNEGFNTLDTVAIQGAGPIGIATAIRSKLLGAGKVIMLGAPRTRLDLARRFGVDHIIDINEVRDPNERVKAVLELTNGLGADVVVEASGNPSAIKEGLEMVRVGGVYYELGCTTDTGTVEINPFRHLCAKDINLFGQWGTPPQEYYTAIKILQKYKHTYPFAELVTQFFPLRDVIKAIECVENMDCLKAVIDFRLH
ncbi:MAG: alcohol dehydrogenase catalytic domain-containing protein [Firmicutes bacterium]|nr:alcohol dehydrogenase catalytic domain-containing protein [Bacillota bacterium]